MLDSKITLAVNILIMILFIVALAFSVKEGTEFFGDWQQTFKPLP